MTYDLSKFADENVVNQSPTNETADHARPWKGTVEKDGIEYPLYGFETNDRLSKVALLAAYSPGIQKFLLVLNDQGQSTHTFMDAPQLDAFIDELQALRAALDEREQANDPE